MTVRTAAQQQVMVKERKWQSSSGELKHLSVYISSRFVSINTNWYIFTKLQVYLEGWQKANALFTRPAIPAGRAACSSVGMRCLMAEWDRRLPCGCWWRLSCECCTSLHPPGWTGRSPWEQDLVWKRSPLEGGKRRATRSQLQTCGNHFCLLLFRTLQAHTREQCDRDSECYWISQTQAAAVERVQVLTVPLVCSAAGCSGGGGVCVGFESSSTAATDEMSAGASAT